MVDTLDLSAKIRGNNVDRLNMSTRYTVNLLSVTRCSGTFLTIRCNIGVEKHLSVCLLSLCDRVHAGSSSVSLPKNGYHFMAD